MSTQGSQRRLQRNNNIYRKYPYLVFGRPDVLLSDEVIEVKTTKKWMAAVGQVQVYGKQLPGRDLRIHLFDMDNYEEEKRREIEEFCREHFRIRVTWE